MISIQSMVMIIITVLLLLLSTPGLVFGFSPQNEKRASSALRYVRDELPSPAIAIGPVEEQHKKRYLSSTTKPKVREIKSLDELQYFLKEDHRPVAIKFYAPWCKSCQRLGLHFDRLALELGDTIQNRQKVEGSVRFAMMEYGAETSRLITETLQIRGVPTLQLYSGIHKLWEENGATTVKGLKLELASLASSCSTTEELQAHAETVDDGILQKAMEETFFDGPIFLNEEW